MANPSLKLTKILEFQSIIEADTGSVWSVAFSLDGLLLAVGTDGGIIQLWDVNRGEFLKILKNERCYEGMNITGVMGLTPVTIANLKALGAVES